MLKLLIPLLALLFSPTQVAAQDRPAELNRGSVLTVRGVGRYEQKPDIAVFDATVTTKAKTLDAADKVHAERATRAIENLRAPQASGLAIEKSRFTLTEEKLPIYSPPSLLGQPVRPAPKLSETPFTARTSFTLKTALIDDLNRMVSVLAGTGLMEVGTITFKVEKERVALNKARRAAMTDARDQAEAYSEAGDVKLVEIIDIRDGEATPLDGQADMPYRSGVKLVQIIPPAVVSFDASVNVAWRISGK